jgi:hypothetical protein
MGELKRLAFKSLSKLQSIGEEDIWTTRVLIPGLKWHFKHPDQTVRVWADMSEDGVRADVYMEFMTQDREIEQPWILSFRVGPCKKPTVSMESETKPFPENDFMWDDLFTKEHVVLEALQCWANIYWPDWKPSFKWGRVESEQEDLREALQDLFEDYLQLHILDLKEGADLEALARLGCVVISQGEGGVLVRTTPYFLAELKKEMPGLVTQRVIPE